MAIKNAEKTIKFLMGLKNSSDPPFEGMPDDVVIPVMGPTGVGKSTFINFLLGPKQAQVRVGHGLQSCTSYLDPIIIPFGINGFPNPNRDNAGRLVLVDTPGFDDTYEDDAEILRRISVWLALSYTTRMKLAGVIYLHDITQTRMLGTTRRNLSMFRKLVGKDALKCVILGTTKWTLVDPTTGGKREDQLKADFWKDMIQAGSQVFRVNDSATACVIVNTILSRTKLTRSKVEFLMIQSELAQMLKIVPQTEAGRTLKFSIDELIKLQKRKVEHLTDEEFMKAQQELDKLLKIAKELKVPLGTRIKSFFGIH